VAGKSTLVRAHIGLSKPTQRTSADPRPRYSPDHVASNSTSSVGYVFQRPKTTAVRDGCHAGTGHLAQHISSIHQRSERKRAESILTMASHRLEDYPPPLSFGQQKTHDDAVRDSRALEIN